MALPGGWSQAAFIQILTLALPRHVALDRLVNLSENLLLRLLSGPAASNHLLELMEGLDEMGCGKPRPFNPRLYVSHLESF